MKDSSKGFKKLSKILNFIINYKKKNKLSWWDILAINLCFAGAGINLLAFKPVIFGLLDLTNANIGLKIIIYILLIMPIYYLSLFLYAFIFRQQRFFQKRIFQRLQFLGKLFKKKHSGE